MARAAVLAAVLVGCAGCGGGRHARAPSPLDLALGPPGDCAAFADPRIQAALDERTLSYARAGNRVRLLVNGRESFARRFANAEHAELVLVKTFIFTDDEAGRGVAALLAERARAGALVVLQYDVKGSVGGAGEVDEMLARATPELPVGEKRIIRELRDAGVIVVPANSPTRAVELAEWAQNAERLLRDPAGAIERSAESIRLANHADHEKYWITGRRGADGGLELTAILGGMNIASEYAYGGTRQVDPGSGRGGWRDTDLEVAGPVVNDIVDRFFDVMDYHLGREPDRVARARWNPVQPPAGAARVRFVYNHPLVANPRAIEHAYAILAAATPAGQVIRIETAYFAPGGLVRKALRAALGRGARLAVLTNSPETNDIAVVADASRFAYYAFLKLDAVVALFERRPRPDLGEHTLHSKVASFGRCGPVIVGSANLDAQSSEHNSEDILVIDDRELRAAFDAMYDADVAGDRAERITLDTLRTNSAWDWVRQWGLHELAWYWL